MNACCSMSSNNSLAALQPMAEMKDLVSSLNKLELTENHPPKEKKAEEEKTLEASGKEGKREEVTHRMGQKKVGESLPSEQQSAEASSPPAQEE